MAFNPDSLPRTVTSTGQGAFAITPSNTVPLPHKVRMIIIGGTGGVIRFRHAGQVWTTGQLPAGFTLLNEADMVYADGTTATNLTGVI